MSSGCIFCRIIAGDAPANVVFDDESVTAFRDIHPQAKIHVLVVPKRHFVSLVDAADDDPELLGKLVHAAVTVARDEGIAETGYRLVTNVGRDACQSVDHLHFHVLGGEQMSARLA